MISKLGISKPLNRNSKGVAIKGSIYLEECFKKVIEKYIIMTHTTFFGPIWHVKFGTHQMSRRQGQSKVFGLVWAQNEGGWKAKKSYPLINIINSTLK